MRDNLTQPKYASFVRWYKNILKMILNILKMNIIYIYIKLEDINLFLGVL